jgi:carotenoid cleavage dioxygenase-like enzyme
LWAVDSSSTLRVPQQTHRARKPSCDDPASMRTSREAAPLPDHAFLYRAPAEVRGVALPLVAGSLTPGLRGTLLRNGPGVQHAGRTPVHFLDGYATVASARFEDERVTLNVRHVDLPLARREQAAGRLLGRRPFTNRPGGRLANLGRMQLSTGAAHEVYAWGGSVVAADAAPRPHSGNLIAYVMKPGLLGNDTVTFVEFDDQWRERARVHRSLGVKGALLHDLVATEHHYLVVQFGLLSVPRAAAGGMVVLDAVGLPPGSARVLVVPRRGDGPIREMPLPDGFQGFHLANAWEQDGRLVADTTVYQGQLDFDPLNPPGCGRGGPMPGATKDPGGPWLCRHVLDLASGAHQVTVHRQAAGEVP